MNATVITPFEVETSIRPSGADSEEMLGRTSVRSSTNLTGAFPPPELVRPSPKVTSMQPFSRTSFANSSHEEHGHAWTQRRFTIEAHEWSGSASSTQKSPSAQSSGILSLHEFPLPGTGPSGMVIDMSL